MITYCVSVWGQNLTQRQIKTLKTLQRLFNIKMIRAYRTISHESATAIAGLTLVNFKLKQIINVKKLKNGKISEVNGCYVTS